MIENSTDSPSLPDIPMEDTDGAGRGRSSKRPVGQRLTE